MRQINTTSHPFTALSGLRKPYLSRHMIRNVFFILFLSLASISGIFTHQVSSAENITPQAQLEATAAAQKDPEKTIKGQDTGTLKTIYLDQKDSFQIQYKYHSSNGKTYNLKTDKPLHLKSGAKIRLSNIEAAPNQADLNISSSQIEVLSESTPAVTGEKKIAILLVNFTNNPAQPVTPSQVEDLMFNSPESVNAYYMENSFYNIYLSGTVYGWYTISQPNTDCMNNYYYWSLDAENRAQNANVNLSEFDSIFYVFAGSPDCPNIAGGTIGGDPSQVWIFNAWSDKRVYGHEFGHNLGLHHANTLNCGPNSIDNYANCENIEYGDYFDVMGNFWYVSPNQLYFNAPHKIGLGWIAPYNVYEVKTDGIYQIFHLETANSLTQTLRISKPDTTESYYVSYRQNLGFDFSLQPEMTRGASIHVWDGNPWMQTKFLDMSPQVGSYNGFGDAPLVDGQSFIDTVNGIEIKQLSHTDLITQVEVKFPDLVKPQVEFTWPLNLQKVGKNRNINVTAWATDNKSVSQVEFYRNGTLICVDKEAPYNCSMYTALKPKVAVKYGAKAIDGAGNASTSLITVYTK